MNNHDPMGRRDDGEPYFLLLARDWSAPELIRIWVAIRKRDPSLIDAIVKRIKHKMEHRPYHPKDREHVPSASEVANHMDLWLIEKSSHPIEDKADEIQGAPV